MAAIYHWYRDLMDNRSDHRVKDWSMMSSPMPTIAACVCYAYCAKVIGPRFMENRKPFQIKNILIVYNLLQTLFSSWIFYEFLASGWWGHYNFTCQLVDYSESPLAMRMAATCWWYYFSKFTEFFDTLFFVLRKKTEHVSTLHVIHHGIMPFSVWMGMKFAPGGHSTFFALLNTFVHIVMYFYYMVAAMGPKYQKYIRWKKYLTAFQMIQFVMIFTHQLQVLFRPSCQYPQIFVYWIAAHGFLFLFLFSDFYKSRYNSQEQKKAHVNGYANGSAKNGVLNKGLCMAVIDDDTSKVANGENGYKPEQNGYRQTEQNGIPSSYTAGRDDAYVRHRTS